MAPEGELRLGLRLTQGRIVAVDIDATRPDVGATMLRGRSRAEAQAAVPLLFSLCGRSQAVASRLACAVAAGETPGPDSFDSARASVAAEMVREAAWQALLQWPRWLDLPAAPDAVMAARATLAYRWGLPEHEPLVRDLALAVWGCPASEWLQLQTWDDVRRWAAAGQTGAARFIQQAGVADPGNDGACAPPLLAEPDAPGLVELAGRTDDDADFCRQPVWRGQPVETGALARLQDDALFAGDGGRPAGRPLQRFVARLRELAGLLAGRRRPRVGALALDGDHGAGGGLAWVDNARGLLIHRVVLAGERLQRYRIVAPTEWNFHPRGALPQALLGAEVADPSAARRLGHRLVQSLDPCVSCRIELQHA